MVSTNLFFYHIMIKSLQHLNCYKHKLSGKKKLTYLGITNLVYFDCKTLFPLFHPCSSLTFNSLHLFSLSFPSSSFLSSLFFYFLLPTLSLPHLLSPWNPLTHTIHVAKSRHGVRQLMQVVLRHHRHDIVVYLVCSFNLILLLKCCIHSTL